MILFKVKLILGQLFTNGSINRLRFPEFQKLNRQIQENRGNVKQMIFFLNAHFDFEKSDWKSGIFKIQKENWMVTDSDEHKYPILGKKLKIEFKIVLEGLDETA